MKDEFDFTDGDIDIIKEEIKKYKLDDLITIDCDGYKICGYGLLQTMFNDDRVKESDELER